MEQSSKIDIKTHVNAPPAPSAGKPLQESAVAASQHRFIEIEKFSFYYGDSKVLHDIDLSIMEKRATALIGPSGCGKSTLLRMFNRMNDLIPAARSEGSIRVHGQDILGP